jgi:hypothetical protein
VTTAVTAVTTETAAEQIVTTAAGRSLRESSV